MKPEEPSSGIDVSGGEVRSQNMGRDISIGTQNNFLQAPNQDASSKPRPFYLPPRPVNFVGRDSYFDQLREALLVPGGMFLLSGDPGCGKSSLALSFAWQVQQQFEAVVFQTCGQRSVESVIGELAETLKEQVGEQIVQLASDQKVSVLRNWLQQRRTLLVLDDVWLNDSTTHRQGGFGLPDLLPGPPVSILFTSRRPALPFVNARQRAAVDAFTVEETEETFRSYLGARTVDRHREQLLEFGERVQRLPLAVAAAAQLLQNEFGPLDEAARGLRLEQLRTEIHDVPGLLQRAIDAQGAEERQLLLAASVCAAERFWLPLTIRIAWLNASQGGQARNHLVNAGLLRVVEQDRQWFNLHALIREQLHCNEAIEEFRQRHVRALEEIFREWELRWKECRECLQEIVPALDWLWGQDQDRHSELSYWAYGCAWRIGELDSALQIEQLNERLWSGVKGEQGKDGLQRSYGNQAVILRVLGRMEEAIALLKKQEILCEELGNKDGLQRSYGNKALILQGWGRLEESMALYKKQEILSEQLGNKDALSTSYGNQALILQDWGRLKEAMALHKKEEALYEELGDKDGLQVSYGSQALILKTWGHRDDAMTLLKRQEYLCKELGNKYFLQRSYGNQALILLDWGHLEEAMALLKKTEAICEELGNRNDLQRTYANQAIILARWGYHEQAMALHKKQEALCEALGDKYSLQASYGNQALILKMWGQLEEAMILLKKAEAICEELANKDDLQRTYGNQALILKAWARLDEAMVLHEKEEALCKELGNKSSLAHCYFYWGLLAREMKITEMAQEKLQAALDIFTELKMPRERDTVLAELGKEKAQGAGR